MFPLSGIFDTWTCNERDVSMKRTFSTSMQSTVEDSDIKIIELAYMLAHTFIVLGFHRV